MSTARLPHPELAAAYAAAREAPVDTGTCHLDSAAAGRMSLAVRAAIRDHLDLEARVGGYVAHEQASERIDGGRHAIAELCGGRPDRVMYTESATAALRAMLLALRLPAGSQVAVLPCEFGPNLRELRAFGLEPCVIDPWDGQGQLDLGHAADQLDQRSPALVHLCYLGSHRGVVQPVRELARLGGERGIPVLVDAAQGFGHLDCRIDADAIYGTSRKWLCGPRGVGFAMLRDGFLGDGAALVESQEAYIAGRVGLAVALEEHLRLGPPRVRERLHAIGQLVRGSLDGRGGWQVVEPHAEPCAVTTLRPPAGFRDQDVAALREHLLACSPRMVTTYAGPERGPLEATRGVLRVSPHLDVTGADLEQLSGILDAWRP
ncbi:aminotransferase class V-fold PLP-dependent enzyme [Hoyosella sp. G463]|uniref:Aminotransferase class V-fold PLP-dependent enzyme n=1 Tax=Lolliginicoccus lacisalsi TaxID=2742202 RepID=A0A927PKP6_9ACTN|nr:aminotransferase class V-fold PLP-dependent enzyme [Lolliginicoccus lacisalsi]MBD8506255.1 aminotransferase class V-fold PLP-dependent enzyme [Lolliginicoccus lacisalsi]